MTSKSILVIDDDEMIVDLCCRVLEGYEYKTRGCLSGEEAVQMACRERFDMVILDLSMPDMDGLETYIALRDKQPGIIGVLITGHATIDTAILAMERGLSGFIRKPFLHQELIQVVRSTFQRYALAEENARLKTLLPLYELSDRFLSSQSQDEILEGLIETLSRQTGAQRLSVMLYDEKENKLRMVSAMGIHEDIMREAQIKPGEKIAGQVFVEGNPLILNGGPEENPRFKEFLKSENIVAAILFPLKSRDRSLGVLNISKVGKGTPFSEADIEMVSVICRQAVMALGNLGVMREKEEKVRMRTLLEQYVAPEVAGILMSRGQDLLDVGDIVTVTVLFADIRNFTPLVRLLPLKTIRSFLNDCFGLFSEVIFEFKGTLDKFLGDAVLAFFGAPISLAEPEGAAVRAAIRMEECFEELKEVWAKEDRTLSQVGLGIGISAGEIFLGNVGSKRRLDYTVIGADVNIAQRLASEASSGEILVTEQVRNRIGSQFLFGKESSRLLKGLDEPIRVWSTGRRGPA